jgi:hypothetical protein
MPVQRTDRHAGKALLVAGVGVAVALGLAFAMSVLASRGDVQLNLGDPRFDAGDAERTAGVIADGDGLPLLYQDLVGGGRNLFVQHTGDDPEEGWVAFGAFDPADPSCAIEIDRDRSVLVNACDPAETHPLTGEGLRSYPTTVEDGRVIVDINEITTTTTAP